VHSPLVEQLSAALGRGFIIERELGGGGMSRVFVAFERALERRVVVKVRRSVGLPPFRTAATH
jgi:serine/threonine-protein kinase